MTGRYRSFVAEREKQTGRQTDRERKRDRQTQTETETEIDTQNDREGMREQTSYCVKKKRYTHADFNNINNKSKDQEVWKKGNKSLMYRSNDQARFRKYGRKEIPHH